MTEAQLCPLKKSWGVWNDNFETWHPFNLIIIVKFKPLNIIVHIWSFLGYTMVSWWCFIQEPWLVRTSCRLEKVYTYDASISKQELHVYKTLSTCATLEKIKTWNLQENWNCNKNPLQHLKTFVTNMCISQNQSTHHTCTVGLC